MTGSAIGLRLFGRWSLISYEVAIGGRDYRPVAGRAEGVLHLTADGWMSAIISPQAGFPDFPDVLAYAGPYRIVGRDLLIRPVTTSIPAWRGVTQRRRFAWCGRRLHLSSAQPSSSLSPTEASRGRAVWTPMSGSQTRLLL